MADAKDKEMVEVDAEIVRETAVEMGDALDSLQDDLEEFTISFGDAARIIARIGKLRVLVRDVADLVPDDGR